MFPDNTKEAQHPFDYQKPSQNHIDKISEIRNACKSLYDLLCKLPFSRESSLAKTKLEEVSMWANKAIVFTIPPNQES